MWSHLSGVNHKPKRNHHQTNKILKATCLAYVSVRGSTKDRWHAEIRIIGGEFYKSVGRSRKPIQESTELEASKNCFTSTSRPERMKKFWRRAHIYRSCNLQSRDLACQKQSYREVAVRINALKSFSFPLVSR